MNIQNIINDESIVEYLRDESRRVGHADGIYFPENENDVVDFIKKSDKTITIQGARTGLAASAVPEGGYIMNMSCMNKVLGCYFEEEDFFITLETGVILINLRKELQSKTIDTKYLDDSSKEAYKKIKAGEYFFTPDPTETTASIGGMISCNSSGARSFMFGSTREHVYGIRVVLSDGEIIDLKRGECFAKGYDFSIKTLSGKTINGKLPDIKMPDVKKNTAAYYIKPNMDIIDVFIGSEGTLGVITSATLKLAKSNTHTWGVNAFFDDEYTALKYVRAIREQNQLTIKPCSIEFFNHNVLNLLREAQNAGMSFAKMEKIKPSFNTAIYTEFLSDDKELLIDTIGDIIKLINELGGNPKNTWLATGGKDMEKLHLFRHSAPECVNMKIDEVRVSDSRITKLGTDMSVPDDCLEKVIYMYNSGLKENGLNSVIFGHIGNNHVHVNIIPSSIEEYEKGKELYKKWAKSVVDMGGSVSAEHGVGKLKIPFLKILYNESDMKKLLEFKKIFNPHNKLNAGNIFDL